MGIPAAEVAAISSSDELAIFLGCEENFFLNCGGTLATVSLAGGSPRTLAEHVAQADWHPMANALSSRSRRPTALGWSSSRPCNLPAKSRMVRASSVFSRGQHDRLRKPLHCRKRRRPSELLDMNGKHTVLFKSSSVEGLAWSPDGKELWFAATETGGWADTIYAIRPGESLELC